MGRAAEEEALGPEAAAGWELPAKVVMALATVGFARLLFLDHGFAILTPDYFLYMTAAFFATALAFGSLVRVHYQRYEIAGWTEECPPFGFLMSFFIGNVWVWPLLWLTGKQMWELPSNEAYTLLLREMDNPVVECLIFTSLMGLMLKDFVVLADYPSPLFAAHHVGVVGIMVSLYFCAIRGIPALAFAAVVAEAGTNFFVAFVLWKSTWRAYLFGMTLSNAIFLWVITLVFMNNEGNKTVAVLYAIGLALICGRMVVMVNSVFPNSSDPKARKKPSKLD